MSMIDWMTIVGATAPSPSPAAGATTDGAGRVGASAPSDSPAALGETIAPIVTGGISAPSPSPAEGTTSAEIAVTVGSSAPSWSPAPSGYAHHAPQIASPQTWVPQTAS